MSLKSEQPGQSEIKFEHRTSFEINDPDGRDSSQQSPAASSHLSREVSREESASLSITSSSPDVLSPRPNAHYGARSTRRSWMASERRLAASLDHLSAKDLAVHLYNAFALSQRARNLKSRNEANDGINEQAWSPPKLWTAWPLAPALVPAEDEGLRWESESYLNGPTSSKKLTPREVLEDILTGRLQNVAKERFLKEHSHGGSSEIPEMHLDGDEELNLLEPVVMTDDDLAKNLTEPTVQHVIAKLDGLLTALHHARHAYVATEGSTSDSYGKLSSRKLQQKQKSKHDGQNESRSGKTKMRVSTNSSPSKADSDLSGSDRPNFSTTSNIEPPNPNNRGTKRRYGLRDWSDIIGIAAMAGWEPRTVKRAAIRCATLFEEGMKFRTLEENGNNWDEILIPPNTRDEEAENNLGGISSKKQGQDHEPVRIPKPRRSGGDRQGSRFYCPVTDCKRSSRGFWQACRLTRHLRQVHKELTLQNAPYESDDQLVGGVHVDGFLQPVPMPSAWANKSRSKQGQKRLR